MESEQFLEPIKEFLQGITNSPLSAIAETFLQIVPEPVHFQVALNVLLPIMNDASGKLVSLPSEWYNSITDTDVMHFRSRGYRLRIYCGICTETIHSI